MSKSYDTLIVRYEAARIAVGRVRDLHKVYYLDDSPAECWECETVYPCRTIRALNGEPL